MTSEVIATILGIAGLVATTIASGLGLYFTARARTGSLRQSLYDRQLELVERIIYTMGRIRVYSPMVLEREGPFHERAVADLRTSLARFVKHTDRAAALLPTELYVEVSKLSNVVSQFLGDYENGRDGRWFPDALAGHSAKVALLARSLLGVDELSEESRGLFSKPSGFEDIARLNPEGITATAHPHNRDRTT